MVTLFSMGSLGWSAPAQAADREVQCDIVIAEASLGGVAAALQALRMGATVCMTSMTDWVGGQLSTQAVPMDESNQWGSADQEFLSKYARRSNGSWVTSSKKWISAETYSASPHLDEVERTMRPLLDLVWKTEADCWVSTHCFPPSEANRALRELLSPWEASGKLILVTEAVPKRVVMNGPKIVSLEVVHRHFTGEGSLPYSIPLSQEILDWYVEAPSPRYSKDTIRFFAPIFIDGTETGELIVLSGARYRLGFEGAGTEPAEPECVMGFTVPINLEAKVPDPSTLSVEKQVDVPPADSDFKITSHGTLRFWNDDPTHPGTWAALFDYRRISQSPAITAMNFGEGGNDYMTKSFISPPIEVAAQLDDWRGGIRPQVLAEAEQRSYSFVNWLNLQPSVAWNGRSVSLIKDLNSLKNFFGTGTGLSKFPYLRETRRMEGFNGFFIKSDDIGTHSNSLGSFPGPQYTNFQDSVGIGSYPFDARRCPTGRVPGAPYAYTKHYQIPLRALVSANISNLLSANKTLAVSQVANTSYRVHPTEWNAGFGAGTAAMIALRHHLDLHQVVSDPAMVREVQWSVISSGGHVVWFSEGIPPAQAH